MISKRTFRFFNIAANNTRNAKISICRKHKPIFPEITESPTRQQSCKSHFTQSLWKRHDCGKRMGWRTSNEDGNSEFVIGMLMQGVVDSDSTVYLIMHTGLYILLIFIPADLDAVHADIGLHDFLLARRETHDLREKDEGSSIFGPAHDLR